jgi:[ribosomal protein S5]-alanine N-acetyltransferase
MSVRGVDPLPRQGPRIVLRRLRPADLENFQAYRSDPEVGRYQSWPPMSSRDAASFLEEMSTAAFGTTGEWFQLGIAERSTDRLIGDMGICIRDTEDKHAELGVTLAAQSQGQGLGSEAVLQALAMLFESSDITRVVAITDTRNHATVRLLQRIGMKLTETLASDGCGETRSEHVFAVGRHDAL